VGQYPGHPFDALGQKQKDVFPAGGHVIEGSLDEIHRHVLMKQVVEDEPTLRLLGATGKIEIVMAEADFPVPHSVWTQ